MNRLVSLLLILVFVLGPLWPHSHAGSDYAGMGAAGSGEHTQCVHVHLRAGHDHSRHALAERRLHGVEQSGEGAADSPALASSADLPEHDADAIYIAVVKWAVHQSSLALGGGDAGLVPAPWTTFRATQALPCCRVGEPPERYSRLPAFLLQSALRV